MRIVAVSDTHLQHDLSDLPDGDLLIHAGDGLNSGRPADWYRFKEHLISASKGFKNTIYVPGNHDHFVQDSRFLCKGELFAEDINLLVDEEIKIQGKRIYGSPWTPRFGPWAYMRNRGMDMRYVWAEIPEGLDILILHGPPMGILDQVPGGEHVGCWDLRDILFNMKNPPKMVIFGHIHLQGNKKVRVVTSQDPFKAMDCYNVAMCTESYDPLNAPTVIDV